MTALFSSILAMVVLGAEPGGMGLPFGIPPAPDDPVITRAAPEKCLLYVNWTGTAAPDPKGPSEAERLLAEPEVQHFLAEMGKWIKAGLLSAVEGTKASPENNPLSLSGEDTFQFYNVLLTHPTVIFVSDVKLTMKKPRDAKAKQPEAATAKKGDAKPGPKAKPPVPVPPKVAGPTPPESRYEADVHAGMVVALGAQAAGFKALAEKCFAKALEMQKGKDEAIDRVQIAGQTWYRIKAKKEDCTPVVVFGFKGDHFIAGAGEGVFEAILARLEKEQPPAWLTAALSKVPVERRTGITYVNLKALREVLAPLMATPDGKDAKAVIDMLGLDNAEALIYTVGLDARGYVNKILLALDGPPRGLLRLVSERPLRPEDLAPIPRDATLALALRLDLREALDIVLSSVEKMGPQTQINVNQALEKMERDLGINIRRGLLGSLGDTWCIYNSPGEGGFWGTGLTAVVPLRNHPAFTLAYAKVLDLAKKSLPAAPDALSGLGLGDLRHFTFAGHEVCYVGYGAMAPAWCVMPREIVMALTPQNVKAYLSRQGHKPLATAPEVARVLPASGGPVVVAYVDTPKLFEMLYPFVSMYASAYASAIDIELGGAKLGLDAAFLPSAPAIARHLRATVTTLERNEHGIQTTCYSSFPADGIGAPLALLAAQPAISLCPVYSSNPVRRTQELIYGSESSSETQEKTAPPDPAVQAAANLTRVGEAIGKYAKEKGTFPAAYVADPAGKPLLSWRVAILPYLGQEELYKQFRLNEPWDSEHNRKLAARMPECFKSKAGGKPDETNFLAVCGEKAVFPGGRAIRPAEVTDGLSNTVMVVTAAKTVVWTKPEDFAYDEKNPLAGLARDYWNGALALRCDGKVCHIPYYAYPDGVRAVFTRAGGEILIPVGGAVLNDMLPTGPAYQGGYSAAAPTYQPPPAPTAPIAPVYQATPAPTAPAPAPKGAAPAPPAPGPPARGGNLETARRIAANLTASGQVGQSKVEVRFRDGTAWLKGQVRDQQQKDRIATVVLQTPGVTQVIADELSVADQASTGRSTAAKSGSSWAGPHPLRRGSGDDNRAQPVAPAPPAPAPAPKGAAPAPPAPGPSR
ncbi:MAG: DUF1559 domain-containing protein [Thermoguttaceae bacterium]|jgi:hypothetical protein